MIRCGVDIENVRRFENRDDAFFSEIFTNSEIEYCRGKSFPAQHFCGIYCAKEALSKVLSGLVDNMRYIDLEITHDNHGRPFFIKPDCLSDFDCDVSISHTTDTAVAYVILLGRNSLDQPNKR